MFAHAMAKSPIPIHDAEFSCESAIAANRINMISTKIWKKRKSVDCCTN